MPSKLEGGEIPVQFEAVTALALLWFAREKCDLVVLETGLGGRCDATNIVPNKLVAAITKIGLRPHRESSVIRWTRSPPKKPVSSKKGCAVVNYPEQPAEAMGPILGAAAETNTSHHHTRNGRHAACCVASAWKTASTTAVIKRQHCSFPGAHQANHAAMAVEIALALWREFGYDISDDAIEQGLDAAPICLPASRCMRRHPLLLLDGCHNPDGARMLAATLTRAEYEENLVGVHGRAGRQGLQGHAVRPGPLLCQSVYTVTPACPRALRCRGPAEGSPLPHWMPRPPPACLKPCTRPSTTARKTTLPVWSSAVRSTWPPKPGR